MKGLQKQNFDVIEDGLSKTELSLKISLRKYQDLHNQFAIRSKLGYDNNQNLLSIFTKIASNSFKPIELILRFLDDEDILNIAATCQTLYRFIYSPFGYTIMRSLRPITLKVRRDRDIPSFNRVYLQNLCNDISLVNLDEDDKAAIILTMKTNLIAAKQKIKQIEKSNSQWQNRIKYINEQMVKIAHQRDQQQKRIQITNDQIQKLFQLLQQSSTNINRLKKQQQKLLNDRQGRRKDLEMQKDKLCQQKQLLIKKIKSQQKQRQQNLIYARQVNRITTMLNKLTVKK